MLLKIQQPNRHNGTLKNPLFNFAQNLCLCTKPLFKNALNLYLIMNKNNIMLLSCFLQNSEDMYTNVRVQF